MNDYQCSYCKYIYSVEKGDPLHGIPPRTPFEELPEEWRCPICGKDKTAFRELESQHAEINEPREE